MPNHVTNVLTITGKDSAKVFEFIKGKPTENPDDEYGDGREYIDFNKIVPMPAELADSESGGEEMKAKEFLASLPPAARKSKKGLEEYLNTHMDVLFKLPVITIKYVSLHIKYGTMSWYDWSCKYWGTKWNAYHQEMSEENVIQFDTAWSTPHPVIKALSKLFPKVTITISYADEDCGNNCGSYTFKGGKLMEEYYPPSYGEESLRFACEILGYDYDDYDDYIAEQDSE